MCATPAFTRTKFEIFFFHVCIFLGKGSGGIAYLLSLIQIKTMHEEFTEDKQEINYSSRFKSIATL